MQEHSNLIQKDSSYEWGNRKYPRSCELVLNRGQSKTSYTKKEVVNVYLDQNVETLHKVEKISGYVLILNAREGIILLSL